MGGDIQTGACTGKTCTCIAQKAPSCTCAALASCAIRPNAWDSVLRSGAHLQRGDGQLRLGTERGCMAAIRDVV